MQPMTVTEIAAVVSGVWWNPCEQVPAISAVSTDSRNITPGCLFLPWVGEQFDGHNFIDAALDAGAVCAPNCRMISARINFTSRWRIRSLRCGTWPPLIGTNSIFPLFKLPAASEKPQQRK